MVAYSFKKQFEAPIRARTKLQTLREPRMGRGRHARVGENLQLYVGMRTKHCRLVEGSAVCNLLDWVEIRFGPATVTTHNFMPSGNPCKEVRGHIEPEAFAVMDGFENFEAMARFWWDVHRRVEWGGVRIGWGFP